MAVYPELELPKVLDSNNDTEEKISNYGKQNIDLSVKLQNGHF